MTFYNWNAYFESNKNHFSHINWQNEMELSGYEEKIVASALQQFQRGENSDGKHLMKLSEKMNDSDYTLAIKGLIKEEQNHAQALGQFMEQEKIPLLETHWLDHLFKKLIRTPSLQLTIMVLLTAELVAKHFYAALYKATNSKTLKSICNQILVDEAMHINFQIEALQEFYHQKNIFGRFFFRNFFTVIMVSASLVVWFQYRKVWKASGLTWLNCSYRLLKSFYKSLLQISSNRKTFNHSKIYGYVN